MGFVDNKKKHRSSPDLSIKMKMVYPLGWCLRKAHGVSERGRIYPLGSMNALRKFQLDDVKSMMIFRFYFSGMKMLSVISLLVFGMLLLLVYGT